MHPLQPRETDVKPQRKSTTSICEQNPHSHDLDDDTVKALGERREALDTIHRATGQLDVAQQRVERTST
ncbi:hypothetical protein Jiend_44170 [Micromonospora endophytica]|nr:hypothetical protein Jiend_44170 [Micromonospora endophytica]